MGSWVVNIRPQPASPPPRIFGETRRLDGNVAYVEIATFEPKGELVRDEIRDTMNAAADASALIIDVRRNGGGMPEPAALVSSYIFDDQAVELSSIHWRPSKKTNAPSWVHRVHTQRSIDQPRHQNRLGGSRRPPRCPGFG
jgi:C-terminal processing protease CtpA/Prc